MYQVRRSVPKIIGISAKMGCGKTTLARMIKEKMEEIGFSAKIISVADELKKECSFKFQFPLEWCYSDEGKNKILTIFSFISLQAIYRGVQPRVSF